MVGNHVTTCMEGDSLDARLALVADHRRRVVIELSRHKTDGETSFDRRIERCWSVTAAVDEPRSRRQFAAQLCHNHLPKLEAHGVVEHDTDEATVRYRSNQQVEAVLKSLPEEPPVRRAVSRRR